MSVKTDTVVLNHAMKTNAQCCSTQS